MMILENRMMRHPRPSSGAPSRAAGSAERWPQRPATTIQSGGGMTPWSHGLDFLLAISLITDAMAELVTIMGQGRDAEREARREAYMRQKIRKFPKGRERVAVVCGAWHAPVLRWLLPPAAADVRSAARRTSTQDHLDLGALDPSAACFATGYGAGVASPGWYHHLWITPDRPIVHWLAVLVWALRVRDLPVSSAHVIEAVRLAETLATVGRPPAGLAEVTEATPAVLRDGDELEVRHVTDHLVVGQAPVRSTRPRRQSHAGSRPGPHLPHPVGSAGGSTPVPRS